VLPPDRPTFPIEDGAEAPPPTQGLRLQLLAGPSAGHLFEVASDRVVIGTHEHADIRLEDPTVSRFHCEVRVGGSLCEVLDLGSRNGTIVNGLRIQRAELPLLATLQLGNTSLRVERIPQPRGSESAVGSFGPMIGRSAAIRAAFTRLEQAAQSEATVLLEGETGTGKELAAELLHQHSPRRAGPFVIVDCASVPADLLESELFGHLRGAFTGAVANRLGAFSEASGGTIFLDEVGELPPMLQPKLLRVLERKQIKPIGSNLHEGIDVRVIAATNRNLFIEVNDGAFRPDLYYRLAVLTIRLPPLRERPEDLPLLVDHLLDQIPGGNPIDRAVIGSPEFLEGLKRNPWPGNVRELRNYIERYLAFRETTPPAVMTPEVATALSFLVDSSISYRQARERWNRTLDVEYFTRLLERCGGRVAEVAKLAGLNRENAYRVLRRIGIKY
jgi:transcriptional regulator with GAF, ATPase, and Fis domain